ncbi:mannose-1-phosphate guanylyltransferase [Micromonospora orduensis]|uniref:Mannose-1-phosphate guanylyltransferase n=1 Tax=Micromonospora orduensis TaxID=1420891 RepID=A0A5C4QAI6_9ACTN|nr:sugar phosphate nucleotidyltransferase [Micromonospora orduensis]TNH21029.1 mannose-1-phosphate guanylyltransferase [Micromonospora orduensis]
MFYAVIPAGGSGTRLWPLSRADRPKFLLALTGTSESLLQATVSRVAPLAGPDRTYVVTGVAHAAAVARQVPRLPDDNIVVEPSRRESCAAIGLAAAIIARREPTAVMGAFSADHVVGDDDRFLEILRAAIAAAEDGQMVAVGITPTYPETGYGYLEAGEPVGSGPARRVLRFKEKPEYDLAVKYVESGRFYWNASMFVWRVDVFLGELARQQPALFAGLTEIAAAWDTEERATVLDRVWPSLRKISVDFAVMEGAAEKGLVSTVPADFPWNDVGDFNSLGDALSRSATDNVIIGADESVEQGRVMARDTTGSVLVTRTGRLMVTLGLRDVVVVDTADALFVCDRSRAQEVKEVVADLEAESAQQYL